MAEPTVAQLTRVYLKIKDKLDESRRVFKEEETKLKEQQERIKIALLKHCKDNDTDSVRTTEGTFFRQVRTTYWTSDWESTFKGIEEGDLPAEILSRRFNQTELKQFLADNPGKKPKGLNVDSEYVVSIRRPKKGT